MSEPNHTDRAHAKLSASGSARWMNCPGSVEAEEQYKISDESSPFAIEGTRAHELAEKSLVMLERAEAYIDDEIHGAIVDQDMADNVQKYLDYVDDLLDLESELDIELRVDFSHVVPEGFGTADVVIVDPKNKDLHIVDLKYGRGVKVDAFENSQLSLYASGAYRHCAPKYKIERVIVHVVQPRIGNYSVWDMSVKELREFEDMAEEKAQLALTKGAARVPGEKQCQWCKAKGDCKALASFIEQTIVGEFEDLDASERLEANEMTDNQKRAVIANKKLIVDFISAVEASVFAQLEQGEPFEGYKLVEGRSIRNWLPAAEERLLEELGDDAYTKKLIGITAAQKVIGKGLVDELTYKPEGKPTLAPESDRRKPLDLAACADYFESLED